MKESGKNPEHFACSVKHLSEALEADLILTPAGAEPPGPHLYEDDSSISSQNGSVLLSSPFVSSSSFFLLSFQDLVLPVLYFWR